MYTVSFLERLGLRQQHGSAFVVNQGTELSWKNVELEGETLETRTRLRDEGRDREEFG